MNNTTTTTSEVYQIILISAVSLTCVLSIIGSSAIIFSFLAFRELRNSIRFILFNLSIADLIVALSNLAGSLYSINFLYTKDTRDKEDIVCVTQAAVGLIGTDASILWTIVFIVYMYTLLACCKPRYRLANNVILIVVTVVIWLVPIAIFTVYASLEYLGYMNNYSPAFCTINTENNTERLREILGYDIFVYASFIILPIFSVLFFIHMGCFRRRHLSEGFNARQYLKIMHSAEFKLVLIPILFLLIRVWSLVLDIWTVYVSTPDTDDTTTFKVLVVLAGIGDSAQGLVNGILFILLTETIRYKMINCCIRCCCCCYWKAMIRDEENDIEETISPFTYRRSLTSSYREDIDSHDELQESYRIGSDDSDYIVAVRTSRNNSMSNFSSDIPYGSFDENKNKTGSMEQSID